MANRKFNLTEKQEQELIVAYDQSKDGPTRTRYQAVRLYGTGYETKEILSITGCSQSALMLWCRKYREGGVAALEDKRAGGNRAELTEEELAGLREKLHTYTPGELFGPEAATPNGEFWTVPDLTRALDQWYGVTYQSYSSYWRIMVRCGFSYQKPAKVYKSRSAAKVAEFEEEFEKKRSMSSKTPQKP